MPPISQRLPYPRLNGKYYQHSSIQLMINGTNFYDIPDISGIGDSCDPTVVRGLSRVGLGMTAGNNEAEDLQITFFTAMWPQVENVLDPNNQGIYNSFPITIHMELVERGIPTQTRDWIGLVLTKVTETSSYSSEPIKTVATFKPIAMVRNGRNPVSGIDFGYTPSLLTIGSST